MQKEYDLKIIGNNYKVKFIDAYSVFINSNLAGHCDTTQGKISVSLKDLDGSLKSDDSIEITLIHELIEAYRYHCCIGLEHNDINRMAECFHQILQQYNVTFLK